MNEHSTPKSKISRSPRAPILSLRKALERAKALHDITKGRHPALAADAMRHWGYGAKSSGGLQTIATLKLYGLIEDTGSGEARKVQLTQQAVNYVVDERPEMLARARRDFALRPKIMETLWKLWDAEPPGDAVARSQLRVDLGFTDKAANDLLKIYKENLRFAALRKEPDAPAPSEAVEDEEEDDGLPFDHEEEEDQPIKVGDFIKWMRFGKDKFGEARKVRWISPDGTTLGVEGSVYGVPLAEAVRAPAPSDNTPPPLKPFSWARRNEGAAGEKPGYQVTLTENRLQVNATVDKAGLEKLIRILEAHLTLLEDEEGENAESDDAE
jgi:hypothetical protein